jgi:Macrocin-O-methyltransferase (TylF)
MTRRKGPQRGGVVPKTRNLGRNLQLYDAFLGSTGPDRLQRILARYELFKLVQNVPGDIVECGVFRGSGVYTWVKLLCLFKPNSEQRLVAFDFFEKSRDVEFRYAIDKECLEAHAEGWTSREVLVANCKAWGFERLKLIAGDVAATTREYARSHLGARIALLYLDLDNYEGTLACLKNLYSLVSPGGVVAFDEYGLAGYGESDAVDEFFRYQRIRLRSFPWARTPTAYFVKEAA